MTADEREPSSTSASPLSARASRRWPAATPIHFHRPTDRPFTAAERAGVTILFGGLTLKPELVRAVFEGAGGRR
jgi:hypothetical protein